MSKSKKLILIGIVLVLVLGGIFSYKYLLSRGTPLEIVAVKESEIDSIKLQNGGNGHEVQIRDKQTLNNIIENLKSSKYKYTDSISRSGFILSIKLFYEEHEKAELIFSGNESFTTEGKRYSKVTGDLNIEEILKFIE